MWNLIAAANPISPSDGNTLPSVGWQGFLDVQDVLQSLSALVLATVLALVIAFHPTTRRAVDTIEEAELPKVSIMYALVGAVVGVIVLQFGMVVGFVVFGLGGLMRFRTETGSTRDTGRLIVVTLVGLISGLNLPHFAVITTVFAWIVIYMFDGNLICSLDVKDVPKDNINEAADAYRAVLSGLGCRILSESKGLSKGKLVFVFRAPRFATQSWMNDKLSEDVPMALRGEMDWKVE